MNKKIEILFNEYKELRAKENDLDDKSFEYFINEVEIDDELKEIIIREEIIKLTKKIKRKSEVLGCEENPIKNPIKKPIKYKH